MKKQGSIKRKNIAHLINFTSLVIEKKFSFTLNKMFIMLSYAYIVRTKSAQNGTQASQIMMDLSTT